MDLFFKSAKEVLGYLTNGGSRKKVEDRKGYLSVQKQELIKEIGQKAEILGMISSEISDIDKALRG